MITCVTPTGDRPIAFALCQRWVLQQTVKPDQWLVIDDGRIPLQPTVEMDYVRRDPTINDPQHTLLLNLREGLSRIQGDYIIFIEDDEYYAPTYIEEMIKRLRDHEVVGVGYSKYYNLTLGKFQRFDNMDHASLAQTAFRKSYLSEIYKSLNGDTYIDVRIWQSVNGHGHIFNDGENVLSVGMKGLPGRPGIGIGHVDSPRYVTDHEHAILKKWIPNDFQFYLNIMEQK